jgi:hypothetical protein
MSTGFSELQTTYQVASHDNHKLSMWCRIIERSYTLEILSVFVKLCNQRGQEPDLNSFFEWFNTEVKDRFVRHVFKIIWGHVLPIETYRKGNSRNNHHYRIAGEKRMDVFVFQSNHYQYHKALIDRYVQRSG